MLMRIVRAFAGTIGISLTWILVNLCAIWAIGLFHHPAYHRPTGHVLFDLDVQLHLALLATMIWFEFYLGEMILRRFVTATLAARLQQWTWLRSGFGGGSALAVATILLVTLVMGSCPPGVVAGAVDCRQGVVYYLLKQPYHLDQSRVVAMIMLLAMLMRSAAWLSHVPAHGLDSRAR